MLSTTTPTLLQSSVFTPVRHASTQGGGDFDVVVLGGGPGGYVASLRAAKLGLRVACVEANPTLGGTCLNVGCIPSKCLLHSSQLYEELRLHGKELASVGVNIRDAQHTVSFDLRRVMQHKDKVVAGLTAGIAQMFQRAGIVRIAAHGMLTATRGEVRLSSGGSLRARNVILATGSEPIPLPFAPFDESRVVSSTGALSLQRVPERLLVVGAGIIGLELGSVWRRFGSQVTFVEFLDRIAPGTDMAVARHMKRALERQGMTFHLSTKVTALRNTPGQPLVVDTEGPGNKPMRFETDVALVCVGRRPNTSKLGLDKAGVKCERGRVVVDEHCRTNVPGVYAIGDIVRGPMLAHKASEEGFAVAEGIAHGKPPAPMQFNAVPGVLYTSPEVAWVGLTQEDCAKARRKVSVGQFPLRGNGRARSIAQEEGFAKLIADGATGKILGVHIIGPDAGEMIAGATLAIEHGMSATQLGTSTFAHPTVSEVIKDAALAACNMPVHS